MFFLQILDELTTQYGRADHDMSVVYKHLRRQKFPGLGQGLNILTHKILKKHSLATRTDSALSDGATGRRGSILNRLSLMDRYIVEDLSAQQ